MLLLVNWWEKWLKIGIYNLLILCHKHWRHIRPHSGYDGTWSDYLDATCNGTFFHGVAIEILEKYTISCPSCSDSRGATNLKMICRDGEEFEGKTNDRR